MKCQYLGCTKDADRFNGKYCTKEHSPYGRTGYFPKESNYDHYDGKLRDYKPKQAVPNPKPKRRRVTKKTMFTRPTIDRFKEISMTIHGLNRGLHSLLRVHQPDIERLYKLKVNLEQMLVSVCNAIERVEKK